MGSKSDFWHRYRQLCVANNLCPERSSFKEFCGTSRFQTLVEKGWKEYLQQLAIALSGDNSLTKIHFGSTIELDYDLCEYKSSKDQLPYGCSEQHISDLCQSLGRTLAVSPVLHTLRLENLRFRLRDAQMLAEGLRSSSLKHLSLAGSVMPNTSQAVGSTLTGIICHGLVTSNVSWVDFSACNIGISGLSPVIALIQAHKHRRISAQFAESLRNEIPNLNAMPGISRVSLNDNKIGDKGAKLLADCLAEDMWMRAIDLQKCFIGRDGAESLEQVLKSNDSLEILDLRQNFLDESTLSKMNVQLAMNNVGKVHMYELGAKWTKVTFPVNGSKNRVTKKIVKKTSAVSAYRNRVTKTSKRLNSSGELNRFVSKEMKHMSSQTDMGDDDQIAKIISLSISLKEQQEKSLRYMQMMMRYKRKYYSVREEEKKRSVGKHFIISEETYSEVIHLMNRIKVFLETMKEHNLWEFITNLNKAEELKKQQRVKTKKPSLEVSGSFGQPDFRIKVIDGVHGQTSISKLFKDTCENYMNGNATEESNDNARTEHRTFSQKIDTLQRAFEDLSRNEFPCSLNKFESLDDFCKFMERKISSDKKLRKKTRCKEVEEVISKTLAWEVGRQGLGDTTATNASEDDVNSMKNLNLETAVQFDQNDQSRLKARKTSVESVSSSELSPSYSEFDSSSKSSDGSPNFESTSLASESPLSSENASEHEMPSDISDASHLSNSSIEKDSNEESKVCDQTANQSPEHESFVTEPKPSTEDDQIVSIASSAMPDDNNLSVEKMPQIDIAGKSEGVEDISLRKKPRKRRKKKNKDSNSPSEDAVNALQSRQELAVSEEDLIISKTIQEISEKLKQEISDDLLNKMVELSSTKANESKETSSSNSESVQKLTDSDLMSKPSSTISPKPKISPVTVKESKRPEAILSNESKISTKLIPKLKHGNQLSAPEVLDKAKSEIEAMVCRKHKHAASRSHASRDTVHDGTIGISMSDNDSKSQFKTAISREESSESNTSSVTSLNEVKGRSKKHKIGVCRDPSCQLNACRVSQTLFLLPEDVKQQQMRKYKLPPGPHPAKMSTSTTIEPKKQNAKVVGRKKAGEKSCIQQDACGIKISKSRKAIRKKSRAKSKTSLVQPASPIVPKNTALQSPVADQQEKKTSTSVPTSSSVKFLADSNSRSEVHESNSQKPRSRKPPVIGIAGMIPIPNLKDLKFDSMKTSSNKPLPLRISDWEGNITTSTVSNMTNASDSEKSSSETSRVRHSNSIMNSNSEIPLTKQTGAINSTSSKVVDSKNSLSKEASAVYSITSKISNSEKTLPEKLTVSESDSKKLTVSKSNSKKLTVSESDPKKLTVSESDSKKLTASESNLEKSLSKETNMVPSISSRIKAVVKTSYKQKRVMNPLAPVHNIELLSNQESEVNSTKSIESENSSSKPVASTNLSHPSNASKSPKSVGETSVGKGETAIKGDVRHNQGSETNSIATVSTSGSQEFDSWLKGRMVKLSSIIEKNSFHDSVKIISEMIDKAPSDQEATARDPSPSASYADSKQFADAFKKTRKIVSEMSPDKVTVLDVLKHLPSENRDTASNVSNVSQTTGSIEEELGGSSTQMGKVDSKSAISSEVSQETSIKEDISNSTKSIESQIFEELSATIKSLQNASKKSVIINKMAKSNLKDIIPQSSEPFKRSSSDSSVSSQSFESYSGSSEPPKSQDPNDSEKSESYIESVLDASTDRDVQSLESEVVVSKSSDVVDKKKSVLKRKFDETKQDKKKQEVSYDFESDSRLNEVAGKKTVGSSCDRSDSPVPSLSDITIVESNSLNTESILRQIPVD